MLCNTIVIGLITISWVYLSNQFRQIIWFKKMDQKVCDQTKKKKKSF